MNKLDLDLDDFIYDCPGACPECGSKLIPINYYRASSVSSGSDVRKIGNDYQTVQYKKYSNVETLQAGLCPACREKDWQAKEEEKAKAKNPPIGSVVIGLVLVAIGVAIFLYLRWTGVSVVEDWIIYVCVGSFGLGVFWSIIAIFNYEKAKRLLLKYRRGWREPLPELSTSLFSSIISNNLNRNKKEGTTVYLSEDEVKQMTVSVER